MIKENELVTILCADCGDEYTPLTRATFWKLYHQYDDSVEKMVNSGDESIKELLKRSGSISFSLQKLEQKGIKILTFLDEGFPFRLLEKLNDFCPPLFYVCGEPSIGECRFVGYVGSRNIEENDIHWTENNVSENLAKGFGIVSGGAKGIDSVAINYALNHGGKVVVFLADNINDKIKDSFVLKHIWDENLVVFSHFSPLAKKTRTTFVSAAMERNKFIYALSVGTAVVRSDLNKGGTWSGATEALKHGWAYVYAWDNENYPGNKKLIEMGAIPLDDEGNTIKQETNSFSEEEEKKQSEPIQLTLFDLMNNDD